MKMPCHITDGPQTPDDVKDRVRDLEIKEERADYEHDRYMDEKIIEAKD